MNTALDTVADELGIDLTSPELTESEAETARIDAIRSSMTTVAGELAARQSAIRALTAVGHTDTFADALSALDELETKATREYRELKRDFIDTHLTPLAEEALPSTKYPWLFAMATYAGGPNEKFWLGQYSAWCDENPTAIDPWTVADLSNPNTLREGELCRVTTIYEQTARTLTDIEAWLLRRLEGRAQSKRKADERKARQKALKAVNRERKAEGREPLPDPDTKAGRDEIARLGREANSYSYNKLGRDSIKNQTEEQTAAHRVEHARLEAIANEAIYGNAAGERPHPLYKTSHELTSRF